MHQKWTRVKFFTTKQKHKSPLSNHYKNKEKTPFPSQKPSAYKVNFITHTLQPQLLTFLSKHDTGRWLTNDNTIQTACFNIFFEVSNQCKLPKPNQITKHYTSCNNEYINDG